MTPPEKRRVGLVTFAEEPSLTADDAYLLPPLRSLDFDPVPVVWDDPSLIPADFDVLLIRSTWDYHLRLDHFLGWVRSIVRAGVPVWNGPDLIEWNSRKTYLLDLVSRGHRLPETVIVSRPDAPLPPSLMDGPIVLKPTVSAGAYLTTHLPTPDADSVGHALSEILKHSPAIVQEFMPEIHDEGELSFVFVEGTFCHAVRKKGKSGDFRVQEDHGGSTVPYEPSTVLIRQARACLDGLGQVPLFARVDAVRRQQDLVIMELELIEPSLYLLHGPETALHLAQAVHRRLSEHG